MKFTTLLIMLGSGAAGFLAAVFTPTPAAPAPAARKDPSVVASAPSPVTKARKSPRPVPPSPAQVAEWNALVQAVAVSSPEITAARTAAGIRAAQTPDTFMRWLLDAPRDPPQHMLQTFFWEW